MPITSFYINLPPFHQTTHHVVQLPSLFRDVNQSSSMMRLEDRRARFQSFERDDPLDVEKSTTDRQAQLHLDRQMIPQPDSSECPTRQMIPQPDSSEDAQSTRHDPIRETPNDDSEVEAFLNTVIRVSDLNPPLPTAQMIDDNFALVPLDGSTEALEVGNLTDLALNPWEAPAEALEVGNSSKRSRTSAPEHNPPVSPARASGRSIEENDIRSLVELGPKTRPLSGEGVKGEPESISSALRHKRTAFRRDPYPIRSKSYDIQSHSTTQSDESHDGSIFTLSLMSTGSINDDVEDISPTFWLDMFHSRKVKAKTFYTCWYLYSTRSSLDSPPTLSPGLRGPKHNYLFVHVNEAQREKLSLTPSVTDGRPTLLKCMTMWIWNGIAQRWEYINYGEERFIADAKSPYCVSLYRETIHPEWITKKAMNKILKKYRGM
ncbi:hypothetical protein C8J55DRAFT_493725 [Lentinula edodes]|uniref:Uncharacterized protein n=1 Tax=Lentinula lateritia TaxID=40482 RepID=A0A9W8ZT11_9AGAR|nr:hypothetical protein C8J55DRAFT_493721 [Lentinula edodes]KAJ4464914.1 hypothetical protein C8J55DRAFT_493725 [Lentinula edodes]